MNLETKPELTLMRYIVIIHFERVHHLSHVIEYSHLSTISILNPTFHSIKTTY